MTPRCKHISTRPYLFDFHLLSRFALSRALALRSPDSASGTKATKLSVTNWSKEKIRVLVKLRVVKHTKPNGEGVLGNTALPPTVY